MAHEQVVVVTFKQVRREEMGAAFKTWASVIGHSGIEQSSMAVHDSLLWRGDCQASKLRT